MLKPHEVTKIYWTMYEVAVIIQENASAVRYWDMVFDLKIKKGYKGNRKFTIQDVENLKRIKYLLKVEKYTLEGAKKVFQEERDLEKVGTPMKINA